MQPSTVRSSSLAHTVCQWSPVHLADLAKSLSSACSKTLTTFPDYENYKSYFEPLLLADISADLQSALDKYHRNANSRVNKVRARREEAGSTIAPVTVQNITSNHTYGFGYTVDVEPRDKKGPVGCIENDVVVAWQSEKPFNDKMSRLHARHVPPTAVLAIVVRTPTRNGCRLLLAQFPDSNMSATGKNLEEGENPDKQTSAARFWDVVRVGSLTTIKREFDAVQNIRSSDLLPTLLRPHAILLDAAAKTLNISNMHDHLGEVNKSVASDVKHSLPPPTSQLEHNFTAVIAEKHNLNDSQIQAILHGSTCQKGFAVVQGPPGTGKTRTLIALLNVIHMTQYQKYYEGLLSSIDAAHSAGNKKREEAKAIPTERHGEGSLLESMMMAMNKTMEISMTDSKPTVLVSRVRRPRLLICAPSNSAVDEVVTRLMSWRFFDGRGRSYCPELARIGAGDKVADAVKALTAEGQAETFLERVCPEDATSEVQLEAQKSFLAAWQQKCNALLTQMERTSKTKESSRPLIIDLHEKLERMERDLRRLKIVASNGKSFSTREEKLRLIARTYVEDAQLVFATLSGSGSGILASNLSNTMESESCLFDTVIIDEAAQGTEPSCLIPMTLGCSRCLLVGDPQQLPATTLASGTAGLAYGQSLLERVFRAGMNVQLLNTQYRMHPAISSFPRRYFYNGRLKDDESVQGEHRARPFHRDAIKPKLGPYVFLDISEGEERRSRDDRSIFNSSEAELAASIYSKLKKEYPADPLFGSAAKAPGSSTGFGVITPYKRQMQELRQSFERNGVPTGDVEIDTVDSFQGREKDVVIFSCVRTAAPERGIGFVRDVRRMNVGLTRARSTLIILGSAQALAEGSTDWSELVEDANSRGCLIRVNSVERCLRIEGDDDFDEMPVTTHESEGDQRSVVTAQNPAVNTDSLGQLNMPLALHNSLMFKQPLKLAADSLEATKMVSSRRPGNHPVDPRRRFTRGHLPIEIVDRSEDTLPQSTPENSSDFSPSPEETLAQVSMALREAGFESTNVMEKTLREHVKNGGVLDIETVLAAAITAKQSLSQNTEPNMLKDNPEIEAQDGEKLLFSGDCGNDEGTKKENTFQNDKGGIAENESENPPKTESDSNKALKSDESETSNKRNPVKPKSGEPSGWEMLFGGENVDRTAKHGTEAMSSHVGTRDGNDWNVNDDIEVSHDHGLGMTENHLKRMRASREENGEGRGGRGRGRSRDRGRKRGRGRGRGRGHIRTGTAETDGVDEEIGEEWMGNGMAFEGGNQGVSAPSAHSAVPMGMYGDPAAMQAMQRQAAFQHQMLQQQMAFQHHPFQPPVFQQQAMQHAMLMQMSGMAGAAAADNTNRWYTGGFQSDNMGGGRPFNVDNFDENHENAGSGNSSRPFRAFRGPRGRGGRRR